ncbi:Undecaprenyl-phosphate alpha-N-acetylglucosaminyl 1-phosphate transferase [anaerobic digester metagenome]
MLLSLLAGVLVSVPCCVIVPRLLAHGGFLDMPGERSSHVRPTPKGGGVGIVLTFTAVAVARDVPMHLWLPLCALAALSFANDLRGIAPDRRLAAQVLAAAVALGGAWWFGSIAWSGLLLLPAVLFVVGTTNCFNFMDGINGIAGICGVTALSGLIAYGVMVDAQLLLPVAAVIGGVIGFLPFNMPRARLFMGDAGSIFLGFLFAVTVCISSRSWTEYFVLASFLYPFYADEAVTMAERIWRGESLMQPHRRHLYQFLANELGVAHWKVSAGYGLVQLVVIMLAVVAGRQGLWAVLALDLVLLGVWAGVHWNVKRRFHRRRREA